MTSITGLHAVANKPYNNQLIDKIRQVQLTCQVTPAPFILRPYAGLYNPFSKCCSILCNHPTSIKSKEYFKKIKDMAGDENMKLSPRFWRSRGKRIAELESMSTQSQDIMSEDLIRRCTETDSRPLTPAPTIASNKSKGSRRCYTPDHSGDRPAIYVDLKRSHSQETVYFHGANSEFRLSINEQLRLRSRDQLPALAYPAALTPRTLNKNTAYNKHQIKALNINKASKKQKKKTNHVTIVQNVDIIKEPENIDGYIPGDVSVVSTEVEVKRRGKRRKKARNSGSDRLTAAGLAAQSQQDPETQVAGIRSDSKHTSSRATPIKSVMPVESMIFLHRVKDVPARKNDSFLGDDLLKFLHREVDEEALHTEFDAKRRYVLLEALRTRPSRPHCEEMQTLMKEVQSSVTLGDWLHVPRVFSRQNVQFTLPIQNDELEEMTSMQYAARYVTIEKSKQLLYLTVLRKFHPGGYRMNIDNISAGLMLMMGGILTKDQVEEFKEIMRWEDYVEEANKPDDIKLTIEGKRMHSGKDHGDFEQQEKGTIKFCTWCGLCAICERKYGRFKPRDMDAPDGMELSDFSIIETCMHKLKLHPGLRSILETIRTR